MASVEVRSGGQQPLRVMSFNLRYASPTPPNAWPARLPVVQQLLEQQAPDVIGTQEGLYDQLKDIEVALPAYRWIGLGRDGGSHGEFMAVFYRPDRLEPLEFDHFWLSDTPDVVGSATWGNTNRRMVTWVRFLDGATLQQFYYFNTHLDFTDDFHERSLMLLVSRMTGLTPSLPVVLAGDFNAPAGRSRAWDLLVGGPQPWTDTWQAAKVRRSSEVGTFHDYKGPAPSGERIDWILTRGHARALAAEIVQFVSESGQYPSDHFPIVADLVFETPASSSF